MQLALFDFDNTVTTCDTYSRFLRRIATSAQLAQARWKVGPWLLGYRAHLVSAKVIRARVTQLAFAGRSAVEVGAQGASFAHEVLPQLLYPQMMQRIEWHQTRGHTVVLVSASLDVYLAPWCERHGLALLCNRLEQDATGCLTGRYHDADIGPAKAKHIREHYDLNAYERIHAYGDSGEDRPMLALAHERWYRGRRVT